MKVFNEQQLKSYICELLGDEVPVSIVFPKLSTTFIAIPPVDDDKLKGSLGESIKLALEDDDAFMYPTEAGSGIIFDMKNWLNSTWKVWGFSPDNKVLLYKPGELHIFSLEELGKYLCEITNCVAFAYAYPEDFRLNFEVILPEDWKGNSPLAMAINAVNEVSLAKPELNYSGDDLSTLSDLSESIQDIIWGKDEYYICPADNGYVVYTLPDGFQEFIDNFGDISAVIIGQTAEHPLASFIEKGMKDIEALVNMKDLEMLMSVAPDAITMLQDVVTEGIAAKSVAAMASMLL